MVNGLLDACFESVGVGTQVTVEPVEQSCWSEVKSFGIGVRRKV